MGLRLTRQTNRAILESLTSGNARAVRMFLARGWNPALPLGNRNCLIYVRNKRLLLQLIKAGAKLDEAYGDEPPLLCHVRTRSLSMVQFYLDLGANPNVAYAKRRDPDLPFGTTPVIAAISHNSPEIFARLLEAGADPNLKDEHGHNALWHAAYWNRSEMIKALVKRGAQLPEDVLAGPVYDGNVEIVKLLIKKGANVNPQNIRRWDRKFDNFETLLGMSIRRIGFFDYPETIAPLLIKAGADVDQRWLNRPPINLAAVMGLNKILRELIKAGADVNAEDTSGNTALEEAAMAGNLKMVKMLIKAGADVNHQGRSYKTPLEWAWRHGHPEIVKLLENAGSQTSRQGRHGPDSVGGGDSQGEKLSTEAVIRAGANVNYKGPTGKTPWQLAKELGHQKIVELLMKFGARS